MKKDYDAILVGGDHNGLTTAADLYQTDGFEPWFFVEIAAFSCELH